jgi:hypothetical protein
VGLIIAFPQLVSGGLGKQADLDTTNIKIEAQPLEGKEERKEEDPMEIFKRDAGKK